MTGDVPYRNRYFSGMFFVIFFGNVFRVFFFPYCLLLLFASASAFAFLLVLLLLLFASAFASADYLLCIDTATKLDDKTFTLSFDTQLHQSTQSCLYLI